MKHKLLKCNFIYSLLVITLLTCLLNFISVPLLSDFFINYFNLFSTSVILLVISIFIGVSNKMDFKLETGNAIYVSKAVLVIMAIELLISLNFQILDSIQDRVFAYAI
jgi:magnesium-transporting ATPase (P-type)